MPGGLSPRVAVPLDGEPLQKFASPPVAAPVRLLTELRNCHPRRSSSRTSTPRRPRDGTGRVHDDTRSRDKIAAVLRLRETALAQACSSCNACANVGRTMLAAALPPWTTLEHLDARAVLDILIIAALIYSLLKLLRGTRALQMMLAILLLVLIYRGARWARLEMVEWLLTTLLPYFAIALIVLFQSEIRRALSRFGRNVFRWRFSSRSTAEAHGDLALAASYFSQNRIGALVVLERDVGLRTYIESGIPLDATLSYDLLLAIFRPGSPLHDGAAIVQADRIAAAGCFLPLSLNPAISNQLGTRHRAAIGVTEESDAAVVLVSEQTGAISLAAAGAIELNLTVEQLTERLATLFARIRPPAALPTSPGEARPQTARK
ncbi:MAG: TIGR00159 family protein [Acidobacteria bacterium]|nr:MAG: TIGR00159 family protein [Acidobacteriota bacterium]